MNDAALGQYRPPESQILLLRAVLGERDEAAAAWAEWNRQRDLDAAAWSEVRLLAALAPRLQELDPASPLLPRIRGIRRFVWTQTQMRLAGARPLLAALKDAGVRMIPIKGASRIAREPAAAALRLLRDIDVLVHPTQWPLALATADACGWLAWRGWPYAGRLEPETPAKVYPMHHAIGFEKGDDQVDIHHHALYMCRNEGDDDRFWQRARPGVLQGVPVQCLAPTDDLLQVLTHGMLYSEEPVADWVLDATTLIRAGGIDWHLLERETVARRIEPFVVAALRLLTERFGIAVPAGLADRLEKRIREPFLTDFVAFATGSNERVGMIDTVREAAALRALSSCTAATAPPGSSRRVIPLGEALIFANDGTPFTFPVPADLPAAATLRLELDAEIGMVPEGRPLDFEIAAPGIPLKRWRSRLRGRYANWPRRRILQLDLPAIFYTARRIDRVTVNLMTPNPGRDDAVRALAARWIVIGGARAGHL